jgi:hypothetical protein
MDPTLSDSEYLEKLVIGLEIKMTKKFQNVQR